MSIQTTSGESRSASSIKIVSINFIMMNIFTLLLTYLSLRRRSMSSPNYYEILSVSTLSLDSSSLHRQSNTLQRCTLFPFSFKECSGDNYEQDYDDYDKGYTIITIIQTGCFFTLFGGYIFQDPNTR